MTTNVKNIEFGELLYQETHLKTNGKTTNLGEEGVTSRVATVYYLNVPFLILKINETYKETGNYGPSTENKTKTKTSKQKLSLRKPRC